MIKVYNYTQGNQEVPVKFLTFPAGERHVSVDMDRFHARDIASVVVSFRGSDDIIDLILIADVLRNRTKRLTLSYMPFARQDRAVNDGEANAIRAFCNVVNTLGFESVWTHDPHSDVVEALIPNLIITPQDILVYATITSHDYDYIIAPDIGAAKKCQKISTRYNTPMLQATKKRDLQTGKIIGYELIDKPDLSGKLVLVVDDICDGGGTFLALSNAIDEHSGNACEKHLYVTHGIFSKGKEVLNNHYSKVFCYNDMSQENDK